MTVTIKIRSSIHSVMLTIFDTSNNLIFWDSCNDSYATKNLANKSYEMARKLVLQMNELQIDDVNVIITGPGSGRDVIRALMNNGIRINYIKDMTPIPHNGVRPMKRIRKK